MSVLAPNYAFVKYALICDKTFRWERRRNLQGVQFKNCLAESEGSDRFIRDSTGSIVGSEGFYQDILHYITDSLNVTVHVVDLSTWTVPVGQNPSDGVHSHPEHIHLSRLHKKAGRWSS